jgi:hypothetical protein
MSPRAAVTVAAPSTGETRPSLAALGAPLLPQVDLLPPEIRSRRALGKAKVRLGFVLIVVLLLAVAGFVYAGFAEKKANDDLAAAERDVSTLEAQQAEYAEVPLIRNQIATIEAARIFGTSTEVMWADYLRAIEAVSPTGWSLRTMTTALPSPLEAPVLPLNPLAAPGVGSITFSGRAATVPDIAAWVDALETIPGFSDAYFSTSEVTEESGAVFYDVAATVQVNQEAFALRYVNVDEEEDG